MPYTQTLTSALQSLGLTEDALTQMLNNAAESIEKFKAEVQSGAYPAFGSSLHLPAETATAIAAWQGRFQHILILGMGGSSLGGRLIDTFADPAHLHTPRLHFLDHLCPVTLQQLLTELPWPHTAVLAISKSGGTLETMTQLELCLHALQAANCTLAGHVIAVTEPTANPLRMLAQKHAIPTLEHHPSLGGRYSIFGETGTIPALLKGLDVTALHSGAQHVLNSWLTNPLGSAPALGAALQVASKKPITAMYVYGEPLRILPAWFEQLWAESLGKNGHGSTPLGASGPAAQHSIQQLFLDGPADKLFTLLIPQTAGQGPLRASDGHPTGTLQQAMAEGTAAALATRRHPVRTLTFAQQNAETLGALLMHFMLETVLTASLLGVNPFNQPAVEESKIQSLAALKRLQG